MLGTIEQVDLREIWKHEASDFTNWLANEDNIKLLSEKVGIDMQVLKTEANVGSFSADILAEELNTGKKIIIENQLEMTNHDHLGKLITYASGLDAKYVIWIFKDIREEHRSAIDWLNEVAGENLNIFAIKMEVWKIGDSLPAPVFNLISSPNGWQKAYKKNSSSQSLTDNNLFQLDFWEGFSEYINSHKSQFKSRKALPQHWYNLSIGTQQAYLSLVMSVRGDYIRIDLTIPNNKALYQTLYTRKEEVESQLGFHLEWLEMPDNKMSRIAYKKDSANIQNTETVEELYRWFLDNSVGVVNAFKKYMF